VSGWASQRGASTSTSRRSCRQQLILGEGGGGHRTLSIDDHETELFGSHPEKDPVRADEYVDFPSKRLEVGLLVSFRYGSERPSRPHREGEVALRERVPVLLCEQVVGTRIRPACR